MGQFKLFVSAVAEKIRKVLSIAFDGVDEFLDDFGAVMAEYGDPMKEFLETTVLKIEAYSNTPIGQAAMMAMSMSDPKLAMAISVYRSKFVPMVEEHRGKSLSETAINLLVKEAESRIGAYVKERDKLNDWPQAIEMEISARPKS